MRNSLHNVDIRIRRWMRSDELDVVPMIRHCLQINYDAGADMEPTQNNADALWILGIGAALKEEPCLVAFDGIIPVGYTLWCELPNPLGLDFRGRVLHGLGTYVIPEYRKKGISTFLRNVAEAEGGRSGFTKVVGTAYTQPGFQSVIARNYRIAGTYVQKELSCAS
jgi:GNAT superfamily N-acetyltransferase